QAPMKMSPEEALQHAEVGSLRFDSEFTLTFVIIGFALVALGALMFMTRKAPATENVLRVYVVVIIIFGTLLVVSSSYTTAQTGPVLGLFGTIAGYILGRAERRGGSDGDDKT